jgi:hypothetical protein
MEYAFAEENFGYELKPMFSLANKNPGTIVGCILVASDPYSEKLEDFYCIESSRPGHDRLTALKDFAQEQKSSGQILVNNIHACLILREPDSFLSLSTWVSPAYKLDYGQGNVNDLLLITFLELLKKQNIDLFICQGTPLSAKEYIPGQPSKTEWKGRMKELIWNNFSFEAGNWLLKSWFTRLERFISEKHKNYTSSSQNSNALDFIFIQEQSLHDQDPLLTTMSALVDIMPNVIVGCLLFSDVPKSEVHLDPFRDLESYGDNEKVDRVIEVAELQQNRRVERPAEVQDSDPPDPFNPSSDPPDPFNLSNDVEVQDSQPPDYLVNLIVACLIVKEPDNVFHNLIAWVYDDFSLNSYQGNVEDLPVIQFLKLLERKNIKFRICPGNPWADGRTHSPEVWQERMKILISEAVDNGLV